jgi:hypothetical protein
MIPMLEALADRVRRAWLVIVVATVVAYGLRSEEWVGYGVGVATLALAYVKARLVVLDFMELRQAPPVWRGILEGWLLLLSVALLAVYCFGTTTSG